MADFEELRAHLSTLEKEARTARNVARTAAIRAGAQNSNDDLRREAELAARRAKAVENRRFEALATFEEFSDPRRGVSKLSDDAPFLLLPVRLETRFMVVSETPSTGARTELCVRIYPDECSTDTFDPELSVAEIDGGFRFWREFWRAAGDDARSRAAWQNLAGSYGSGRAAWIVQAFAPSHPEERPTRPPATDLVLVIAGSNLPEPAKREALATYWRAIWKAGDDVLAKSAALTALHAAFAGDVALAAAAVENFVPFNLNDPAPPTQTRTTTTVTVAFLDLPADLGEDRRGWRRAPVAAALPERFVVIAFSAAGAAVQAMGAPIKEPLILGPDPGAPEEERILPKNGELEIPDPLKWIFDFDAAVACGLGIRVPLTPAQAASGFDRIVVLGVRLRSGKTESQANLEELLRGHSFSRAGFELLPQGAPTNNTDDAPSAWSRRDNPDLAYDDVFGPPKFELKTDPLEQRDGQVLAERLGISPNALVHVRGADGRDALESRAMNTALSRGTLGYTAGTLMSPVFHGWVEDLLHFFNGQVLGRGAIPPIRIGAQPFGIIASTAFSRISWLNSDRLPKLQERLRLTQHQASFLQRLQATLNSLEATWREKSRLVARVGAGADPHKTLLEVLGLHPNSAEFHTRNGKSLDELEARAFFTRFRGLPTEKAKAAAQRTGALQLLRKLGYLGPEPDILDLFFRSGQIKLKGALIEPLPLSETTALAASTTDQRNYLEWLAETARVSLDGLRRQEGFLGDVPPNSLLYIMLHFALVRGYLDAGDRLRADSGVFSPDAVLALKREPKAIHLSPGVRESESPWRRLYEIDARINGGSGRSVADHITATLATRPAFAVDLSDQIRALEALEQTPTARLERAFVEHLDVLSYRFDAWRLGLVNWQLDRMRKPHPESPITQGLYLGAYGYLEEVRPKPRPFAVPVLPAPLAESFRKGPPLKLDPTNGGHLHAPSLDQAVTAAMLRAGELNSRSQGSSSSYQINLASERVRKAIALLEGVRSGHTLGALLGYRFERSLHDFGGVLELDALIFAFRRAFPLVAEHLTPTQNPPPPPNEAIEARNVVNGLLLVQRTSVPATNTYPFGASLPSISAPERAAVEKAVSDLKDHFDAMADLMLAESLHQAAQGNPDRATAHLDVASDFNAPPDPAVVRTPHRGFAITCRVGLELAPLAVAAPGAPPRVQAQPALNAWLTSALPPLNTVACRVTWTVAGGPLQDQFVSLADLGLAPLDVISLVADEGGSGFAELDDRMLRHVVATSNPRSDAQFQIRYQEAPLGQLSVFVASALIKRLRSLTQNSRPLRASDTALPSQAEASDSVPHVVDKARVENVVIALEGVRAALDVAIADPLLADPVANRVALLAGIDDRIALVVERLKDVATFGGAKIGWGGLYNWRAERFSTLVRLMFDLVKRWNERVASCDEALAQEAALPAGASDVERVQLLRAAEGRVSTALAPATGPVPLRTAVLAARTAFVTKRDAIQATTIDDATPGLSDRLAKSEAVLPLTAFDAEPLAFGDIEQSILTYWSDLQILLISARKDAEDRIVAARKALTDHDSALDSKGRLEALQRGAVALFGEGFKLIPTFTLPGTESTEQAQAHAHFTAGTLLAHARAVLDSQDPLDTWFYGAARVRPKLRQLEDTLVLWEALGIPHHELKPSQLPHRAGAPWCALDFPKEHAPDGERLAYVAVAGAGYDPSAPRSGLLLDDWSEVVPAIEPDEPGPQHTTGVAFHFDRPSQEPPQAMLLLTPPRWAGTWSFDDLVAGIVDTMDLARLRAVEPEQLDDSPIAQFLPATVASVTTSGLSISANYAMVNLDARIQRSHPNAGG